MAWHLTNTLDSHEGLPLAIFASILASWTDPHIAQTLAYSLVHKILISHNPQETIYSKEVKQKNKYKNK